MLIFLTRNYSSAVSFAGLCLRVSAAQRRLYGRSAAGAAARTEKRGEGESLVAAIKSEGAGQGEADLRSAASRQHQQPVLHESSTRRQRTHEQITHIHTPWPPTEPPSLDSPLRLRERYFFCILAYQMSGFCNLDEKCLAFSDIGKISIWF